MPDSKPKIQLSRRELIFSMVITTLLLLTASGFILFFSGFDILGHLKKLLTAMPIAWLDYVLMVCVPVLVVSLDWLLMRYVPQRHWFEPINDLLAKQFSYLELGLFFVVGAIGEELLFRGVLQNCFGFWIAAILFAIIHTRYLKRLLLLGFSLVMGCVLGGIYAVSGKLWVVVVCHFLINMGAMVLLKRGKENSCDGAVADEVNE